ncbi:GNAT family N-acetyltransferase [Patescibacteria group bacterium]|nr:GNAT family N-acetyltransferase [Patescibacteria group bacterium]
MVSSNPVQSTVPPSEDSGRELCLFSEPWEICLPSEFEPYYTVEIAQSEKDRVASYALRYRWYCERLQSLPPEDYPNGLEFDKFDLTAVTFVSKIRGEVVGCSRLVFEVDDKFLMETGPGAYQLPAGLPRPLVAESSRLIGERVHFPLGERIRQSHYLLESARIWSVAHGYRFWLVAAQYDFYIHLEKMRWPMRVIGERKMYHNTDTVPIIIDLRLLKALAFGKN